MNTHKFLHVLAETTLGGEEIDIDTSVMQAVKLAEEREVYHKLRKDIGFCAYKVNYNGDDAIIIYFILDLPGSASGSSASTEIVMDLLGFIEKFFIPAYTYYTREEDIAKNIATLTIIKIPTEEDLL